MSARCLTGSLSQKDYCLWETSLLKVSFPVILWLRPLEQERTIVSSFPRLLSVVAEAASIFLLCTVLLLSIESILLVSFQTLTCFLFLVVNQYSCFNSFVSGFKVSCSDLLIYTSLYHGLQLLVVRHREIIRIRILYKLCRISSVGLWLMETRLRRPRPYCLFPCVWKSAQLFTAGTSTCLIKVTFLIRKIAEQDKKTIEKRVVKVPESSQTVCR